MARPLVLLLAALSLAPPVTASDARGAKAPSRPAYYPGADWERRAPEAVGLDPALVSEAVDFAIASERKAPRDLALAHAQSFSKEPFNQPVGPFTVRGAPTGLVVLRGYVVAEWGEPSAWT